MRILEYLTYIDKELKKGTKDNDFSYWVEHELAVNYHSFEEENAYLAREMNDTLPDICEQMEPGMESEKFHHELLEEVNRLLSLLDD